MKYLSFKALDQVPSDLGQTTDAIDLSQIFKISGQVVVSSGTVGGTLQLQVSNDPIETGYLMLKQPTNWSNLGSAVALSASGVTLIAQQDVCYRALRAVLTNTSVLVNTITSVADVASSLNDTYFLVDTPGDNYYVWFNVDSAGTDPAIPGRTGIEVAVAEDDTADDVATAVRAAFAANPDITASGATDQIILTNNNAGYAAPAEDGEVPTGFTFENDATTATVTLNLMCLAF